MCQENYLFPPQAVSKSGGITIPVKGQGGVTQFNFWHGN